MKFSLSALCLALSLALLPAFAGQAHAAAPAADPAVKLETSLGDIVVRLDARKAPSPRPISFNTSNPGITTAPFFTASFGTS